MRPLVALFLILAAGVLALWLLDAWLAWATEGWGMFPP